MCSAQVRRVPRYSNDIEWANVLQRLTASIAAISVRGRREQSHACSLRKDNGWIETATVKAAGGPFGHGPPLFGHGRSLTCLYTGVRDSANGDQGPEIQKAVMVPTARRTFNGASTARVRASATRSNGGNRADTLLTRPLDLALERVLRHDPQLHKLATCRSVSVDWIERRRVAQPTAT